MFVDSLHCVTFELLRGVEAQLGPRLMEVFYPPNKHHGNLGDDMDDGG